MRATGEAKDVTHLQKLREILKTETEKQEQNVNMSTYKIFDENDTEIFHEDDAA
jgi:hypothetical protein